MENLLFLKNLAQQLADVIPSNFNALKQDCEKNLHAVLEMTFAKLQILTREEFDIQTKVLTRTRQKIEELEKTVSELEVQLKQLKDTQACQ